MKKILSILLITVILFLSASLSCFAEDDNYDIIVSVADVIIYDKDSVVSDAFIPGTTAITVTFKGIERFSHCSVNVDYNTDLLKYETSDQTPIMTVISSCSRTKTGVRFSAKLGDMAVPGKSYSDTRTAFLKVNGVGKHDMKISVDVKDLQGNPVDVRVKFAHPYENIVDVSEIDFVEFDEKYMKYSYAFFDNEMIVSDVLDLVRNDTVIVKNADGIVLSSDDKVTTNSRIVTLYEGFEADSLSICVKCDVNCDGKVTAGDARLALRASARLESLGLISQIAADVNGKSGVTAADARLILRKSAKLE